MYRSGLNTWGSGYRCGLWCMPSGREGASVPGRREGGPVGRRTGVEHHDGSFRNVVPRSSCEVSSGEMRCPEPEWVPRAFNLRNVKRVSTHNLAAPRLRATAHFFDDSLHTFGCSQSERDVGDAAAIALTRMYGRYGSSCTVGSRSLPTTRSSSACARSWISGSEGIRAANHCIIAAVCQDD